MFFPEGTSTDGRRVLPFRSTLFAAFFSDGLRDTLSIQPVSVVYTPPSPDEPRFYGWWGDMEFGPSLLQILAAPKHGRVTVVFHPPIKVSEMPDRKVLALAAETAVRGSLVDAGVVDA